MSKTLFALRRQSGIFISLTDFIKMDCMQSPINAHRDHKNTRIPTPYLKHEECIITSIHCRDKSSMNF